MLIKYNLNCSIASEKQSDSQSILAEKHPQQSDLQLNKTPFRGMIWQIQENGQGLVLRERDRKSERKLET